MPFFVALVPLAMALFLVPSRTIDTNACPPGGEGFAACQLQKGWAPYVTSVCLVWLGLYVAGQFTFLGLPRIVAHLKAGDRLRREPKLPRVLTHSDPAIAAAVWGQSAAATPATKVMSGFAWSQASSRAERVTATPALLGAIAPRAVPVATAPPARTPAPVPAPQAPAVPAEPVAAERPLQPVAIQGGIALNVCGECLEIVEGDTADTSVSCPTCGTVTQRRPRIGSTAAPQRSSAATRVILLSAGLDARSIARLQEAITRRPGEPRRVVVLQLPAGEIVTAGAHAALARAGQAARGAEGEIVLVADDRLRSELADLGLPLAPNTSQAMEIASTFAPVRRAPDAAPFAIDRVAL